MPTAKVICAEPVSKDSNKIYSPESNFCVSSSVLNPIKGICLFFLKLYLSVLPLGPLTTTSALYSSKLGSLTPKKEILLVISFIVTSTIEALLFESKILLSHIPILA
ncbi:MAG: hypothetical protein BWY36_00125 [Candidatus Diapherotrites archaeon ADurb.Bin253]|nr:MAG: hypothetical protein BWY36_00125 [Candidatus Diapherotrites archaeon ADurb.Bin253]